MTASSVPGIILQLICVETSPERLVQKVLCLYKQQMITEPSHLLLMTADSETSLYDPAQKAKVDEAVHTIKEARRKGNHDAIRELRGALRNKHLPKGPKSKKRTCRATIEILKRLAAGESEKDIAGADEGNRQVMALHSDVRRFCLQVYEVWHLWSVRNPPSDPE